MSTLPTFTFSCIAADNAGNPVLFGVASGRLEAHAIDLTDALTPTSKLISATSTPSGWDAQSSLGCYSYAGNAPSPSYPINVLQFGATSNLQVNFFPNGTWANPVETATASTLNYQSPKLFSLVGSTDGWNWFVARATPKAGGAASWRGVRAGARIDAGPQDLLPGSEPLFTVGAIAQDIANFGNGFLFSFDQSGSTGTAYQATGNKRPDRNLTATESLLTLTKANAVNMNSLVVTQDAIPLTSGFSAFVVDKSAASVSSKILVYGGVSSAGPSNNIHAFDIISGTWSGPALVDALPGDGAKGGLSPAVIGGAVAGVLVLLAVIGFLVYRRRRSAKLMPLKGGASLGTEDFDNKQAMINLMNMENKGANAPRLPCSPSSPGPPVRHPAYKVETLRTVDPAAKTHPYSQHRSSRQSDAQQSFKPKSRHAPSRQPSSYSVYSDGSVSHISLFPAQSGIYLVDSPSLMPPTPVVPSAYTNGTIMYPQHTYQSPPSVPQSPSRKGSIYKVAVPDDYDDRQPLHRQGTEDNLTYQQTAASRSSTDSPRGSWSGQSDNRPVQHADSQTQRSHHRDGSSSERTHRSRRPSQSTSSPSHSVPTSPATPNYEVAPKSPASTSRPHNRTQSSSSTTRRKKASAAASPRMPSSESASQSVATLVPPSPGFNRSEYRDSGSYKVEYRDPGSSNSSTTAVASTAPTPTSRNRRKVPSPAASESDINAFPVPPASGSRSGPSQGQPLAPISLQDMPPMPYKMNREQQGFWQERQMELLQDPRRQQQQYQHAQLEERQADPQYQQQLKTPKLASLPRPVIRK
ncbi:hypothetical protein BG003_007815 [Podila horticola]|nr:hypothetical protein BG003_007815 [Podila horticola]